MRILSVVGAADYAFAAIYAPLTHDSGFPIMDADRLRRAVLDAVCASNATFNVEPHGMKILRHFLTYLCISLGSKVNFRLKFCTFTNFGLDRKLI